MLYYNYKKTFMINNEKKLEFIFLIINFWSLLDGLRIGLYIIDFELK